MTDIILNIQNLGKSFHKKSFFKTRTFPVFSNINIQLERGKTYGLVGESGSGKSTLANCMIGLLHPDRGEIYFNGENITEKRRAARHKIFHDNRIQMVFQDPFSSLDPSMNVYDILEESLIIQTRHPKPVREKRMIEITSEVGIAQNELKKKPSEFSGGQCQRIAIARALIVEPQLILFDEAVSALDVSIQAQVLNLLIELQEKNKLSYFFISHDLNIVNHMSDKIGVMHSGIIVEEIDRLDACTHPYTKSLIKYGKNI